MEDTPESLNNYLRAYRNRTALTQQDIAALVDGSDSAVRRYEAGTRLPPLMTVLAYEAIFGVPVRQLFAGIDEAIRHGVKKQAEKLLVVVEREADAARLRMAHIRKLVETGTLGANE